MVYLKKTNKLCNRNRCLLNSPQGDGNNVLEGIVNLKKHQTNVAYSIPRKGTETSFMPTPSA